MNLQPSSSPKVEVVVTGLGLCSALGTTVSQNWHTLLRGESAIALRQPFPEIQPCPLGMIAKRPATVRELAQQTVAAALIDAGLTPPLPNCGVVIGSSRSQQALWEHMAADRVVQTQSEPQRMGWLEALPHMPAIATAHQMGATGPVLAPMAACATGLWAIAQGVELIQSGQCDQVVAGAVEAPITPLTLAGFQKMGALATTGCYPFDQGREGLVVGEGAAIFVLEAASVAQRRSAHLYGRILGFGLTADGYHVSAPDPHQRGAIAAIESCLKRSGRSPDQIDYIHAHGTSTQLNDRHEAQLIQQCFPRSVPVSSTKGATGHTLGASGALGLGFCLLALKHQILPPCVGLRQSEFDLNLVRQPTQSALETALCLSFGFGGQNAALVVGR